METKNLALDHSDNVLSRADEITLLDMVSEDVGAIRGLLSVKTGHLDDENLTRILAKRVSKDVHNMYLELDISDIPKLKSFSRYLCETLKGIRKEKI